MPEKKRLIIEQYFRQGERLLPQHIGYQELNYGHERVQIKNCTRSEAFPRSNFHEVERNQQRPHAERSSSLENC
jgi:hypothetical protein